MHSAVLLYPYFTICCPQGNVPVTTWSNLLRLCHGVDLFFDHFPISSRLDPSRRKKSVLHVRVAGLPILLWSRSSKHFLPNSCSSLKLPIFDASVPSLDDCSQRWLWRYHTRSVQCFAPATLVSCSLAHPACFWKALSTLFVHTERAVMFLFRTSNYTNVIRSVRSSHLLSSSEISRPSSADVFYLLLQKQKIGAELHIYLEEGTYHKRLFRGPRVSARSLIGSPRCDFTFIRKVALPARTRLNQRCVSRQTISRRISASGAVANVAFPPCPTHFLITCNTASLSHKRRASSLRAVDCSASTTPPSSGLLELVPSSSLSTRAHLSSPSFLNLQHPDPIVV
jgi:hypothetical protein